MESPLSPPINTNLSASRVPGLLFANVFTFSLAFLVVILRFVSRRISHLPFWWDDYLMIPAITSAAVLFFTDTVYMVNNGLGKHVYVAPDPQNAPVLWAIGLFITEITYTLTIVAVKFSILAFYSRIFWGSKPMRIAIYALGGIVSAWGVSFILITIFDCMPVKGAWTRFSLEAITNPATAPVCRVQPEPAYLSNSAINIVTDVAILILPLPLVWKLNLPKAQKLAVCGIFAIGLFDIGVAISRFVFIIQFELQLVKSLDVTWTFVNTQIWSAVEVNTTIICSSLASLRPLLNLIVYGSVGRPDSSAEPAGTREKSSKSRKSSQNSGSFFEQHNTISGAIKSFPSKAVNQATHFWAARYLRTQKATGTSEVSARNDSFTQLADVSRGATPAAVSRQVSVRKASWKTQNEIKMSVLKGFEGINVHTEIDVDEQSQNRKGSS